MNENILGGKTVQSQYLGPSNLKREHTSEFYKEYVQNVQLYADSNSPIKKVSKSFLGNPLKKIESKEIQPKTLAAFEKKELSHSKTPLAASKLSNNEEIRDYLNKLENMIQNTSKRSPLNSPHIHQNSVYEDDINNINSIRTLEKSNYLIENEGLLYLQKKYLSNEIKEQLNHSTILVRGDTNANDWNYTRHQYKLGEILCANCQEFVNPDEVDAHSRSCISKMNDQNIGFLNDKIENIKLLLIINFKNSPIDENNEEFLEFEIFLQIGTVIIDEIIFNNNKFEKIKENFEDLKELYYSMNRLRTKKMIGVKSLIDRILQFINEKIQLLQINQEFPKKKPSFQQSSQNLSPDSNKYNIDSPARYNNDHSPGIYGGNSSMRNDASPSPGRKPVSEKKRLMDYFEL